MTSRGLTPNTVDAIVKTGKALSQDGGNKFASVSSEGVAVVSKSGKLITAWGQANFDVEMINIVTKLYGK